MGTRSTLLLLSLLAAGCTPLTKTNLGPSKGWARRHGEDVRAAADPSAAPPVQLQVGPVFGCINRRSGVCETHNASSMSEFKQAVKDAQHDPNNPAFGGSVLKDFGEVLDHTVERRLLERFSRADVRVGLGTPRPGVIVVQPEVRQYIDRRNRCAQVVLHVTGDAPGLPEQVIGHGCDSFSAGHLAWALPVAIIGFPYGTLITLGVIQGIYAKVTSHGAALAMDDAALGFAALLADGEVRPRHAAGGQPRATPTPGYTPPPPPEPTTVEGSEVSLVLRSGRRVKGELVELTPDQLVVIEGDGNVRSVLRADITKSSRPELMASGTPAPAPASNTPTPTGQGVDDAMLEIMQGHQITLLLRDGSSVQGELLSHNASKVVVVETDGNVRALGRDEVSDLYRGAVAPPPRTSPPVAEPEPEPEAVYQPEPEPEPEPEAAYQPEPEPEPEPTFGYTAPEPGEASASDKLGERWAQPGPDGFYLGLGSGWGLGHIHTSTVDQQQIDSSGDVNSRSLRIYMSNHGASYLPLLSGELGYRMRILDLGLTLGAHSSTSRASYQVDCYHEDDEYAYGDARYQYVVPFAALRARGHLPDPVSRLFASAELSGSWYRIPEYSTEKGESYCGSHTIGASSYVPVLATGPGVGLELLRRDSISAYLSWSGRWWLGGRTLASTGFLPNVDGSDNENRDSGVFSSWLGVGVQYYPGKP